MTEAEFIAKYTNLIRLHFDFNEIASNSTIRVVESEKELNEFLEFYIPRYETKGRWDNRHIDQIIADDDSNIVQMKDVISSPDDWGLSLFPNANTLSKELWPIPIATDTLSGKTLILDSNHTVCTLLFSRMNIRVRCAELIGQDLSKIGTDLSLM